MTGGGEDTVELKTTQNQPKEMAQKLTFNPDKEFLTELHRRVDEYFRSTGLPKKGGWRVYLKAAIILTCFFASYWMLLFVAQNIWQGLVFAILLALLTTAIGFNIQHDGGHRSFSEHLWVNRLAAMTMDMVGASSYVWHQKHSLLHHNYVNITGYDPDIDLSGAGRLSPHQKWFWFYRWQHQYIWFLYGLLVMKWQLVADFRNLISGRIHRHRIPRPKGWDLLIFIIGKTIFFILAFGLPLLYHPLWVVLFFYAVVVLLMGVPLSVVFQLPHCVGQADFPLPSEDTNQMKNSWAVHQDQVTLGFDRHSPIKTWLLGGLNFHLEHHLFPGVCHVNYPGLAGAVEETCRKFGVKYAEHRSFWTGLVEHYRWLRKMGMPVPD
jgi:linoleoyl-CoA desaturase